MKNGPAAALVLSHVLIQTCSSHHRETAWTAWLVAHFDRNATTPVTRSWCTRARALDHIAASICWR